MHRNLGPAAAVAAILAFVPGLAGSPARAHETTDGHINAFHCIVTDSGSATVVGGSSVVIRLAWGTQVLGDQITFRDAQVTVVSVNGRQMVDVSDQWSAPVPNNGGWSSSIEIPTGVALATGEQMQFTFALLFKRAVPEQFNPAVGGQAGPIVHDAGLSFGGTCLVAAA